MKTITFISNQGNQITTKTAVVNTLDKVFEPLLNKLHTHIQKYSLSDKLRAIRNLEKQLMGESTTIVMTDIHTGKTEVLEKQPDGSWEPQIVTGSCSYAATFLILHWETALDAYLDTLDI